MLTKYKEITKTLESFITSAQPILDIMLEELRGIEVWEREDQSVNTNYSNIMIRQLIVEYDRIKELEFKFGFTLQEIRWQAVLIEAHRPTDIATKEKPVDKLKKLASGLTKEQIQELLKGL